MSLSIAIELFHAIRRYFWPQADSRADHDERLAEHILAGASLFDLLRWRRVSSTFKRVADRRIKLISRIDVKLYAGLRSLHCTSSNNKSGNSEWHPRVPIMVVHLGADHLGIAVDNKMECGEVAILVELLTVFRQTVEKLCVDCPVMEFLVSQVDKQQLDVLHFCLVNSRKQSMVNGHSSSFDPEGVLKERDSPFESPFFPKLRQLTITSQTDQLEHLSRLLLYTVGVEHIYDPTCIELVCLNVCLAGSWSRIKNVRLFRHVNCFRQWSEAQTLGVRYLQQFTSQNRKPLAF